MRYVADVNASVLLEVDTREEAERLAALVREAVSELVGTLNGSEPITVNYVELEGVEEYD